MLSGLLGIKEFRDFQTQKGRSMDFLPPFNPKTMAVIGVSMHNDQHPANVILNKNRLRFPVRVYPVNPSSGTYQGDNVYKNIREIPEEMDLAIIAVRVDKTPGSPWASPRRLDKTPRPEMRLIFYRSSFAKPSSIRSSPFLISSREVAKERRRYPAFPKASPGTAATLTSSRR